MSRAGISGAGVISALGDNAERTRSALFSPSPRLPEVPRRIATKLALPVFEIPLPPDRAGLPSLPLRFLLQALDEALADARLTREDLRSRRVGIAIGTTVACQLDNLECHARLRQGDFSDLSPVIPYVESMPAEYLRRTLGVAGPALTVSNACSSGSDSLMIALEWLRTGRCDLVIAGGCDTVSKVAFNGFNALRVSSAEPCRPFDAERSGLNLGDAAGVLILEAPERARARGVRVEYELGGAGKTADGFHITQPESSGRELERAIRIALEQAELAPDDIDFVNAHGTGTPVNDRVESAVLARVFGEKLRYHSTKALTGHTLGAAGAIEAVFTELMLEMRRAAPSRRCEHAAEDIAMDAVAELFARPGRLREGVSLKTYLFTMGRSRALNYIKRRGKIVFEELPEDGGPADFDADLEEKVLSDEKRRAVNEAVRDLPPDMRDAVWLVYFEEMSYKEAAAVMKKKEKQIDNLIFRAKRELRVKLGEKGVFSE